MSIAAVSQRLAATGPRTRVAFLAVVLALGVGAWRARGSTSDESGLWPTLHATLASHALEPSEGQLAWLAPDTNWRGTRPALFLARKPDQPNDVYYAELRLDDDEVLEARWLTNLTRSSGADERSLIGFDQHAAFAVNVGGRDLAFVLLDADGEPDALTEAWPLHARLQNAITNLQETGRLGGFGRRRYELAHPCEALKLHAREGLLEAHDDGGVIVIDPNDARPRRGAERVAVQPMAKGQPGLITWAVDTARNVSWIGPAPIEWLEHTVFTFTDRATRLYHSVIGRDREAEAEEVANELGLDALPTAPEPEPTAEPSEQAVEEVVFDTGLPPAPLTPVLDEPLKGEGRWIPLANTPFINTYPNTPPAFYQTFLRVDPERTFARIFITLWDPRLVQLHVAMGTREPESATGETGSGMIPRDPELLRLLVGGFNGGFQALHGEFGMMSESRVYLPPKPYAATVAVFEDGRVGMGSWPGPQRRLWDEEVANAQIPADMISMRQNLTSVVEDGDYNPWKRWWWGAAPVNAEEQTYIHRTGLCLTQEGFMAFLWGGSMGPEELGRAMQALRCARGMHLDMNSKHTGLEFYRPFREPPPPLGRELTETEYEGTIDRAPREMHVRARLAVTSMTPLRFPRYLGRDPRDFFFLTLKPTLPGPDVVLAGRALKFSTAGLPQADWPPAFARARDETSGATLLRIDPRRAIPAPLSASDADRMLARVKGVATGAALDRAQATLYAYHVHGGVRLDVGQPTRGAIGLANGTMLASAPNATAALGADREGFLLYAEAPSPAALRQALTAAGVERALALAPESFEAAPAPDPARPDAGVYADAGLPDGLVLLAETRPAASVMFPEVEPKPYRFWGWLQGQRVRYFPTGEPRFRKPEEPLE